MESRSQNAIRNIIYNIFNKMVSILLPFLVRAMFIRIIGTEIMGLNSLYTSILQVLNLSELGFNDAVVFALYKPVAENDTKTVSYIINYYRKVYLIIGIVVLLCGSCVTPFLPFLVKGNIPENVNIYVLYLLYLVNTCISYMLFAYRGALLTAYQRVDITSKISIVVKTFINIVQIIVIYISRDIYLYTFALIFGTIINNVLIYVYTKKLFPTITAQGKIPSDVKKIVTTKLKGLILYKVCMSSRNSFDSIYISSFVGLAATAIYNNYFYILGAVAAFSSAITEALLPTVGNSIIIESQEKNYKDMNRMNFIYLWLAGFCAICMLNLYQPFTEFAFGKDNMFTFPIVVLFIIYYYILRMGDVRAIYSDAHGLWWENRYRLVGEALTNIVLNYLLGKYFGVAGVLWATIISLFVFGFVGASSVLFKYYFSEHKLREFLSFNLWMGSVGLSTAILTTYLCSFINGSPMVVIVVRGLICVIFVNVLFYVAYHKSDIFNEAVEWIVPMINRRKKG